MDEALTVDLLAVYEIGRELVAEGASEAVMRRYRDRRDRIIARVQAGTRTAA